MNQKTQDKKQQSGALGRKKMYIPPTVRQMVVEIYQKGIGLGSVAKVVSPFEVRDEVNKPYNVTITAMIVRRILTEEGVPIRPRGGLK